MCFFWPRGFLLLLSNNNLNKTKNSKSSNLLIHNLAEISAPQVNASQEMGDVDMEKAQENYDTTGDSHVSLIEDDKEKNNEGSSCQQEAMEDESATLPSSEINAVVPDQHLNSFPSRDVSMLAKKRVHDFVLDIVNTASSQPDTSNHLHQSKPPGPDPVSEESSSYPEKVLILSLKENDSSETTMMSSGNSKLSLGSDVKTGSNNFFPCGIV